MYLQGMSPNLAHIIHGMAVEIIGRAEILQSPRQGPAFQTLWCTDSCHRCFLCLSAFSWTIASSRLSSPRTCVWSSIPGMPGSHHHVLCAVSLAVATPSHQTRKFLRQV